MSIFPVILFSSLLLITITLHIPWTLVSRDRDSSWLVLEMAGDLDNNTPTARTELEEAMAEENLLIIRPTRTIGYKLVMKTAATKRTSTTISTTTPSITTEAGISSASDDGGKAIAPLFRDTGDWRTEEEVKSDDKINMELFEKRFKRYEAMWVGQFAEMVGDGCGDGPCLLTILSLDIYPDVGLGNLMFQVGALLGISRSLGFRPCLEPLQRLVGIFHLEPLTLDMDQFPLPQAQVHYTHGAARYNRRLLKLNPHRNHVLVGFLQSYKYFHKYRDEVIRMFTFHPRLVSEGERVLQEHLQQAGHLTDGWYPQMVGVHVRRDDFLSESNVKHGFTVANSRYLEKAMDYFRKRHPGVVFVVCSNDMAWSQANIRATVGSDGKHETVFISGSPLPEIDFYILSRCNHTIITVGTFGWWAAYLNKGDAVYYKDFPRKNSTFDRGFSKKDYYLPHWVGMDGR